jgi:glycosyltransferase involved in cell wall biosynthesis
MKKILFVTGCLEPGKDGVGDYTHELAAECGRLGHQVFLVSLNDPWIKEPRRENGSLRLGPHQSWVDRVKAAKAFLAETGPELVSLQLVLYSFHPAGLSFVLPSLLRATFGPTPVQVMFHELWIGEQIGAPWKTRVFGFCQRKIIQALVNKLACRVMHTTNLVYMQLLRRHGMAAKHLPLFGSVPVVHPETVSPRTDQVLRLGIFGSIHPEWSPEEMFTQLRTLGRPIQLSHLGRIGPGEAVWMDLSKRYGSEIEFRRLGERSLAEISQFFSFVDFGVSTTPLALIGKSSCLAAMLDHGLPVIVNRNDVHFRGITEPALNSELVIPVDKKFLERVRSARRQTPHPRLTEVTEQFLREIGAGSTEKEF